MHYLFLFTLITLIKIPVILAADLEIKLVDKNNKPLSNMVVYLQPLDGIVLPTSNNIIEIAQLDRSFTPHISVMQLGSKVSFENQDDITHHIYSPIGLNKFAFKVRAGQSKIKDDFKKPGEIAMGCNIHDWMSGYLLIVETPLFGKTDSNGLVDFDISHTGRYQLVVWHPKLDADKNRIIKTIHWQKKQQLTIKIVNTITFFSEQKNDDFEFITNY